MSAFFFSLIFCLALGHSLVNHSLRDRLKAVESKMSAEDRLRVKRLRTGFRFAYASFLLPVIVLVEFPLTNQGIWFVGAIVVMSIAGLGMILLAAQINDIRDSHASGDDHRPAS